MDHTNIIAELEKNQFVFQQLLSGIDKEVYLWKPAPEKWCLLEILRHLIDEEVEDFRARTKSILEDPKKDLTPIDPEGWVKSRNYIGENYDASLNLLLKERRASVDWLKSLNNPSWSNAYHHPTIGPRSAWLYLTNWLAHDYLHFKQIARFKYDYLMQQSGEDLQYAGEWK